LEPFYGLGLATTAYDHAAPDVAMGESFDVEAGYDAEVVASAFEGSVEVCILLVVSVDDSSVGENDLY
jgi:hypothetical protein